LLWSRWITIGIGGNLFSKMRRHIEFLVDLEGAYYMGGRHNKEFV